MGQASALRVAIDLMHVPSRVRVVKAAPLPEDVQVLLRIAAGDEAAEIEAAQLTERSREVVRAAAIFFIEQVLLCSEADSYRVLGASPQASHSELRRNLALLLKWSHPDRDQKGERSIYARRVTRAWDDLRTPERRADHDSAKAALQEKNARKERNKGSRGRSHRQTSGKLIKRVPLHEAPSRHYQAAGSYPTAPSLLQRVLRFLLTGAKHRRPGGSRD